MMKLDEEEVRRIQEHSKQPFSEEWAAENLTLKMQTWDALAADWLEQRRELDALGHRGLRRAKELAEKYGVEWVEQWKR